MGVRWLVILRAAAAISGGRREEIVMAWRSVSGLLPSGLLVALLGLALSGAAPEPPEVSPNPKARRHAPIIIRDQEDGRSNSTNWSGYVVKGAPGSVTNAKASWIVPAIHGPCSRMGFSSFWVGIDGFTSGTVEQLGTDSDCFQGVPVYFAWFEIFPMPSFTIDSIDVGPGDVISAEVNFHNHRFTLSMTNETTHQSFSTTVRVPAARRSSVEWIAEAPSSDVGILPLANFGTVSFGEDTTLVPQTAEATVGGATGAIGSFGTHVQEITMVTSAGKTKARPSALSNDGTSFSVTWLSAGP
jgi:Peptidase A4 family